LLGKEYSPYIIFKPISRHTVIAKGIKIEKGEKVLEGTIINEEGFGYLQIDKEAKDKNGPLYFRLLVELIESEKVVVVRVFTWDRKISFIEYQKAKEPKGLSPFRDRYCPKSRLMSFRDFFIEEVARSERQTLEGGKLSIGITLLSRSGTERLYGAGFPKIRTEEAVREYKKTIGTEITVCGSAEELVSAIYLLSAKQYSELMGAASHETLAHELFGHFYLDVVKVQSSLHIIDEPMTREWMDMITKAMPKGKGIY